jgi:hypothetical protein
VDERAVRRGEFRRLSVEVPIFDSKRGPGREGRRPTQGRRR